MTMQRQRAFDATEEARAMPSRGGPEEGTTLRHMVRCDRPTTPGKPFVAPSLA